MEFRKSDFNQLKFSFNEADNSSQGKNIVWKSIVNFLALPWSEGGRGRGRDRGTMLDWTTFYSDKFGISEKLVSGSG